MRILLVITSLGVGGAERLVISLADRFTAAGHEVCLAWFHSEAELKPLDARVSLVNLGISKNPLALIKGLWRLRKLILEFKPDVVNSHLVHANILTRLLRLITPMPRLISSAHNTNEEGRFRMLAYRFTDRLANISTNVSDEAVQAFIDQGALLPGRMMTIHNGIDTDNFKFGYDARVAIRNELGLSDSQPVLLAVGRFWEAKDYPNLFHALAKLQGWGYSPKLIIAGDGPLREKLVELSIKLKINNQVYFLGVRHDVLGLMSAGDIFVLSSAWEGLPMVVLEAMACQRLVVATDCGGVRGLVGESGLLVPPQDSGALAIALKQALNLESNQRVELGKNARKRVEKLYSLEAASRKWLRLYRGEPVEDTAQPTSTMES
ncbi:glycosyltransferase [Pistricoccus aurantiacus]|uniref:Glycosyltransferase n=1 Tax=Pistricoccus aurantiacus TaxID=1883414 RepID=A0A5B8STQ2_9GAMM|nr:glycosyltransferase [Pistricoccus aurantiacus]